MVFGLLTLSKGVSGQSFFVPSDTLNKPRFYTALSFCGATYTAFSIGFYNAWYKNFEQEPFHLFNDWHEWKQMDKVGHVHSAYFQGLLTYKGARWTGLNKKKSVLTGIIASSLFQTTLEVMDGFSAKWGFSIPDMGANVIGTGLFAAQQHFWDEQRISIKVSSIPKAYPDVFITSLDGSQNTTLTARANSLYGRNFFERFLKDYNAQTYWLSVNVKSFLPKEHFWPGWLNVGLGYGAENMYGGFDNTWNDSGASFTLSPDLYPRYRQYYLGLDVDLTKLKTKSPLLKSIFSVINIFRIPLPALEFNSQGKFVFHAFK
jgi:hypothetical protein